MKMSLITKSITTTLILVATASAGSAFAQSSSAPELSAKDSNDWVLKGMPSQNQSFIFQTNNEDNTALLTPLPKQDLNQFIEIETPIFSRIDVTNFKYPVLGAIKIGVQSDYQELLWSNNTIHISDITYLPSDSSPYSQTPYQVATTATAQLKFAF
jgi:hypothetical protein